MQKNDQNGFGDFRAYDEANAQYVWTIAGNDLRYVEANRACVVVLEPDRGLTIVTFEKISR